MTLKQGNVLFFLSLLLLIAFVFLFIPYTATATAEAEPVITFNMSNRSNEYGNPFWSDATVRADGRLQYKGIISDSYFTKDAINGDVYLVYEPHGRIGDSGPIVKLTDDSGKIVAEPGTYTLVSYPQYDYADIVDAEDDIIYSNVRFNINNTYTIQPRKVTINVDESEQLLRYYGGPTVGLDYCIEPGSNMINGDELEVTFSSAGNAQEASVGEYDIVLDSFTVINDTDNKTHFYNIIYSVNRPKLKVEKYIIVASGVGDIVDYYRYNGVHTDAFKNIYEDVAGINDETVRIYYTLDEANIVRVNGALPVNLEDGYATIVDFDRLEVYNSSSELVDSRDNYEIYEEDNNTRLIVQKRHIVLYTYSEFEDEHGVFINKDSIKETYGYLFDIEFDRVINIWGEDITFTFSLAEEEVMPEAGEHAVDLISADNDFYNIILDESFKFVIDKYTFNLADYMDKDDDYAYIDIDYGEGLSEYTRSIAIDEPFAIITFTLISEVDEYSYPGEYEFIDYQESNNFIINYTDVIIRVATKPLTVNVVSPRPTGIVYGDEYYFELEGAIEAWAATITTFFCQGDEYNPNSSIEGLPVNAGSYIVRAILDSEALPFYSLGEEGYIDFAFNIARRNIVVKYILNQPTKEYNTEIAIANLGYIINHLEGEPETEGLLDGDILTGGGIVTCAGLAKTAATGSYVVNTSNLGNTNYSIVGDAVKVYYNDIETPSLTVTKLKAENLPAFEAVVSTRNATSITLNNIAINGVSVGSFAISKDGGNIYSNYQTDNTFTKLTQGKKYYFKVRIKGNANIEDGPISAPISQTTTINTPTVKYTVNTVDSITVELNTIAATDMAYEYQYRLGNGAWTHYGVFNDLDAGTRYQIRYKCVSLDTESSIGSMYVWTYNKAPVIEEELDIQIESNRIAFDGFLEDYEYRIGLSAENEEDIDFSDWTSVFDFEELLGDTEYIVQIRIRASSDTGYLAGEALSMTFITPEVAIPPISYDGILEYVAKYYFAGALLIMILLMIIFIIGFAKRFRIV